MVLAEEGMFFVTIKLSKKSGTYNALFEFKINHTEKYFPSELVKGAFEYESGKIIALVNGSKNIRFINRIN